MHEEIKYLWLVTRVNKIQWARNIVLISVSLLPSMADRIGKIASAGRIWKVPSAGRIWKVPSSTTTVRAEVNLSRSHMLEEYWFLRNLYFKDKIGYLPSDLSIVFMDSMQMLIWVSFNFFFSTASWLNEKLTFYICTRISSHIQLLSILKYSSHWAVNTSNGFSIAPNA